MIFKLAGMPGSLNPFARYLARRDVQAFASALVIESLAIAAAVGWMVMHPPRPMMAVVPLSIEAEISNPTPELPAKPPPEPVKSKPLPQQKTLTPLPVTPVQPERPRLAEEVASPLPASTAVEAPAVAKPPRVSSALPVVDPREEYNAKVKVAVQAALVYPPAAAALNFRGRARVEFKLRDGVSSQARILASSGMGLTDRAALQSVQGAAYPLPPAALRGKEETYQVWIEFNQ